LEGGTKLLGREIMMHMTTYLEQRVRKVEFTLLDEKSSYMHRNRKLFSNGSIISVEQERSLFASSEMTHQRSKHVAAIDTRPVQKTFVLRSL
jgi:hypothetical protein